jgi:hypothetical protein
MISAVRSSAGARVALYSSGILISAYASSVIYGRLVASRLMPETFILEFIGFAALWLIADLTIGRCFVIGEVRQVLFGRAVLIRRIAGLLVAMAVTAQWLQVDSFAAELAAFGALWLTFDRAILAAARALRR